jgi:autotransporter strand-loop-strand O-heptosyltransferase
MKPKIYAHASYIGNTGYNNHTRDFFRKLANHIDLKIRNFTIGQGWNWPSPEPHNGEPYLNDTDKKLLIEQTLWVGDGKRDEFPIYENYPNNFVHNVNLVLEETDHHFFYDNYSGPKIAYNVWESTLQPEHFFNKLKEYDQIWVPSQWQADCTIAQGMSAHKVKVVPEGVDVTTFYPEDPVTKLDYVDGRFKFVVFGRWDYRKSTKEIIETFLKEFKSDEPVDLIVSIDNPFSGDGHKTTEDRLQAYGFTDERIKVKHFPSREDYITYMKNGHVFVSCARSEGWNLPLIEAMACGTPAIYSACCAQMEFAKGKGLPVKVLGERPALDANYNHFNTVVGNYYEPDFEDLARVMRDAFENYTDHKKRAIYEAKLIHRDFNWDRIAEIGRDTLEDFMAQYAPLEYGSISDGFKNNIDFEFINADQYCPFFDIEEGDVVLDLGASFGPFIWKAKKNNPSKIYAVEPLSIYHPVIEKNAKGANYELIKKAVTGYNGTLDLEWDIHKETVETTTFKKLIEDYNIDKVDFLKIDIEASEYDVFIDENAEFLKSIPKIVGEIHLSRPHEKEQFKEFYKFLQRHNFNFRFYTYDMVQDITAELATDEKVNWASTIVFYAYHGEFVKENSIQVSFIGKPRVEILGSKKEKYYIEFINADTNEVIHSQEISNNMWTQCNKEYYIPWIIKINGKEHSRLNLENQRVLISLDSKSIGDTIGWTPYAVEFAKKHNCKVILSTFHNDWFKGLDAYRNIEFIEPGTGTACVAHYQIGWFRDENGGWKNFDRHPRQCNVIPMQATASDILGLEYKELNHGVAFKIGERMHPEKYIIIGPNATAGCKEWVYDYWLTLAKLLRQQGYLVISLTKNEHPMENVFNYYGQDMDTIATLLHHADLFIGLGSGLSWLNWALGKHTVMINGFSEPGHEFTKKLTRIYKDNVCFPCWTNPNFSFDAGDWNWCPIWKDTDKQHICQKSITPQIVMSKIKSLLKK